MYLHMRSIHCICVHVENACWHFNTIHSDSTPLMQSLWSHMTSGQLINQDTSVPMVCSGTLFASCICACNLFPIPWLFYSCTLHLFSWFVIINPQCACTQHGLQHSVCVSVPLFWHHRLQGGHRVIPMAVVLRSSLFPQMLHSVMV